MDLLKIVLGVLKFAAIATGSVSGIVGVLTKTKDQVTGKPTPWGRRLVGLILASGLIALLTQSIESYLKIQSDRETAAKAREAADKTAEILNAAHKAADDATAMQSQMTQSLFTLERNVEETRRLRDRAQSLLAEQQTLHYDITHVLGKINASITMFFPVSLVSGGSNNAEYGAWMKELKTAREAAPRGQENMDIYIPPDVRDHLKEVLTHINISSGLHGTSAFDGFSFEVAVSDMFASGVSFDHDWAHVHVTFIGHSSIKEQTKSHSWRDLYGKEVYIQLTNTPTSVDLTTAELSFDNAPQTIFLSNRSASSNSALRLPVNSLGPLKLGENILGPKPKGL
jgi:hypothetical protein